MKLMINPNDKDMFMSYLNNASVYLEFGSGGSTIAAANSDKIQKGLSVETNKTWFQNVRRALPNDKISIELVHLKCQGYTSVPGPECSPEDIDAYRKIGTRLIQDLNPDLIYIDGRYRSFVTLSLHRHMREDAFLLFDDFWTRKWYHDILPYFDLVERANKGSMAVFKRNKETPPESLIEKFKHDLR